MAINGLVPHCWVIVFSSPECPLFDAALLSVTTRASVHSYLQKSTQVILIMVVNEAGMPEVRIILVPRVTD